MIGGSRGLTPAHRTLPGLTGCHRPNSTNQTSWSAKARRNTPHDIRIATAYYKPDSNRTDLVPDYYVHRTDRWLVFPHELDGLTREEIFAHKPGMKKRFENAGLD